jgi:hypothetical protein
MVLEQRKSWKLEWKSNMLSLLSFVSVFYFCFIRCGFELLPPTAFEKMEIKKDYSDADLLAFTKS